MKKKTSLQHNVQFDAEKLQQLGERLSQHFWEKSLQVPVIWNGRLTRCMGRFVYQQWGKKRDPLRIEMSKFAVSFIDREIFVAVLLHELCHYHLFIKDLPFTDHHPVFERELERVGAISTNMVQLPEKVYQLTCEKCQKDLGIRRRVNTNRYCSPCCQANLQRTEKWIGTFQYDGEIVKKSKVKFIDEGMSH